MAQRHFNYFRRITSYKCKYMSLVSGADINSVVEKYLKIADNVSVKYGNLFKKLI